MRTEKCKMGTKVPFQKSKKKINNKGLQPL